MVATSGPHEAAVSEPAPDRDRVGHAPASSGQTEAERVFRRNGFFSALGPAASAKLSTAATRRSWARGAIIFQRGDEGDYLIAISAGQIRLSISTADGKELVLRHVGAGEVIGEFSLIDGQPRSTDASAVEATEGFVLHRKDFLVAVSETPDFALALAQHLCGLLRSTNYQMESIALYDLRLRVVRFLLLALRDRHGENVPPSAELDLRLNQSELAAILGASRPKLNQVLQSLSAEGAIGRNGDHLRCEHAKLVQILDSQDTRW